MVNLTHFDIDFIKYHLTLHEELETTRNCNKWNDTSKKRTLLVVQRC